MDVRKSPLEVLFSIMNMDNMGANQHAEELDADAVCAQCGTVNAEGTLICKVCGNNLRDQRHNRMIADQHLDLAEDDKKIKLRFLTGALVTLGALLVVWVALNANNIAQGLVESQLPGSSRMLTPELWAGAQANNFEDLHALLEATPITQMDIVAAQDQPFQSESATGIYVVALPSMAPGMTIGRAYVQEDGDDLLIVADINGGIELRGRARFRDSGEETAWVIDDLSSSATDGIYYYETYGVALAQPDGTYHIFGMSNGIQEISAIAYRLPN